MREPAGLRPISPATYQIDRSPSTYHIDRRMADNVLPLRRPLTADRALSIIRAAAANTERIGWTDHANDKLGTEIVTAQVLTVLSEGPLKKGPEWNEQFQDYTCVLRKTVSGRPVHVVVGVCDGVVDITIITVY